MSAHPPKYTLAFRATEMASRGEREPGGLLRRLADHLGRLRERYATATELRGASERDLRDMGINRGDIGRLFDPAFAEEYADRGGPRLRPRRSAGAS